MSYNKGGQFALHEDHNVGEDIESYAADVVAALSDEYGRESDGAGGAGAEAYCGEIVDVDGCNAIRIACKVTVAGAHSGNVVFEFAASHSTDATKVLATNWTDSLNNFTTVTGVGAGAAGTTWHIAIVDVRGISKIKLSNIDNSATAVAITANCYIAPVK